ncbi:chaperone [Escherichia coli]|uniref:Chaperone n=1 Tax=Escherichia coli TaxID=562 RepID=A0A376S9Z7_ECOLX|nr:chaperone [Escherichia coli]
MLVVDIGGGTTDCSLLLMGPQWRSRLDREASLLGHSGCRIGGNDLDIALAFKNLMPLLGMGGETEKGIAPADSAVVECGCHQRRTCAK